MSSPHRHWLIALTLVALTACASEPQVVAEAKQMPAREQSGEICPTPRPEICTMEYNPVCGVLGNGERKQYSNGCSACGDEAVSGYTAGPCE